MLIHFNTYFIILAFMVVVAAGDVCWILIFAYVGTSCLYKHCLLKYVLAQQFKSFVRRFLYLCMVYA
jgi:hypothetical protein